MTEITNFISQVGFPIFVAVWMLYKTSKDSTAMQESIDELKIAITTLTAEFVHHPTKGSDENDG